MSERRAMFSFNRTGSEKPKNTHPLPNNSIKLEVYQKPMHKKNQPSLSRLPKKVKQGVL